MSATAPTTAADVQLRSVLSATDFSAASDKALRHAIAIARHFSAEFYLMHVVSFFGLTLAGPHAMVALLVASCVL